MPEFTRTELMVVAAAREITDGEVVFVGIGIPTLATILAKMTHAPNLRILTESGVVGAAPKRLPLSIADPCLVAGTQAVYSTFDLFSLFLQGGKIDVGFLGGAQVDKYGNLNSTVIGPYAAPSVRFPGSGGACEIASLAKRTMIIMPQGKRRFIERVEFVTSPGFLGGGDERERLGLPGGGPSVVVTDLGVFRFDPVTREMTLTTVHPGVTVAQAQENTGWPLRVSPELSETPIPDAETLRVVRALDPTGHFLTAVA